MCTMLSVGAKQIWHLASALLSLASLSPVKMLPVKNLRCILLGGGSIMSFTVEDAQAFLPESF